VAVSVRNLVGREEELAALVGLLEHAELPAAAVVVGQAGIGKTALSLAAAEAARTRGYQVLSCRATESETRFSFAGVADLIGGVVPSLLPQLPRPQRRALESALVLSESDGASADEGVIAFAFLRVLRILAEGGRVLLVIDDVQWLDAPSLAILRFAMSRLGDTQIAIILTARDQAPNWLRRAAPEERLLTIELGPLSVGALRELLRARAGAVLPRPTLLRIWETSGGNPFFALELTRAIQRRGGRVDPGEVLAIPATLEELVQERLDRLGEDGLDVARIVAALAHPTVRLVEVAAGDPAGAGLSAALEAGIVEVDGDRLRFTHPLLRSALFLRIGVAERHSLHARLAKLVPDREERARHLALATSGSNREVASIVEAAATNVRARGAAAASAELSELAIRLTPPTDVDDLRRRILDCADRHAEAGDGHRAISLLEKAYQTTPRGVARAAVQLRLARAMGQFVGMREAIDNCRQALVEAEGDDALEAEIHLTLAELVKAAEDWNLGLEHAELAVQAASRAGDAALRCKALAAFGFLHFRAGRGIAHEQMEEALALEKTLPKSSPAGPAITTLLYQLLWSGELERCRQLAGELRAALNAREDPEEAEALWYLTMVEWRAGNWELAARHAAAHLAVLEQFGLEGSQPVAELPAALVAAHRGQIEEARQRSLRALAVAEAKGIRIAQSGHRGVLGFIELSLGKPEEALEYLELAWDIRDSVLILEPGHRFELADTLEALIAVGRLDDAEGRLVPWEERSTALDRSWAMAITARCRALLLAARGDLAGAQASFDRALAEHARTDDPFQHGRTLLALGATQRRAKQRGAARATLDHALTIFEKLGAPLWADKARVELRRIGGRAPSRTELTEAERRIAALVAEGRTNREVAAALFVTEHTVEGALTRAYQKLGVRSRAALTARLRREPQADARGKE
jgi:DNA-binding CsgD family transcriptional regulator